MERPFRCVLRLGRIRRASSSSNTVSVACAYWCSALGYRR